jgi:hypothetical protein
MLDYCPPTSFSHVHQDENGGEEVQGLFVCDVAGWLCRESCYTEKAVVQRKLLFQILLFGNLLVI